MQDERLGWSAPAFYSRGRHRYLDFGVSTNFTVDRAKDLANLDFEAVTGSVDTVQDVMGAYRSCVLSWCEVLPNTRI
jgi:MoaA/NifB/PqqE/SkfB family radical SAM enzyme